MSISKTNFLSARLCVALAVTLSVASPLPTFASGTPGQQSTDVAQKIGPWLTNLYQEYQQSNNKAAFTTNNPVLKVSGGKSESICMPPIPPARPPA